MTAVRLTATLVERRYNIFAEQRSAARPVYRPMRLDRIAPAGGGRDTFNVVIETARGSRNKYSYDTEQGVFVLKRVLPEGHVFPFDFGFVPRTRAPDGDPLDVLVLMDAPGIAGCVVECRFIGVLHAKQEKKGRMIRNDRLIAVAESSLEHAAVKDIADLAKPMLEQLEHFFVSYNEMAGKKFKVLEIAGAKAARRQVTAALRKG